MRKKQNSTIDIGDENQNYSRMTADNMGGRAFINAIFGRLFHNKLKKFGIKKLIMDIQTQ